MLVKIEPEHVRRDRAERRFARLDAFAGDGGAACRFSSCATSLSRPLAARLRAASRRAARHAADQRRGQTIGTVRAWQTAGGVTFRIDASGLPHGVHGIHVHAVGRCDPPDFASAGPTGTRRAASMA